MKFTDINQERQDLIINELNNHLIASYNIIKKDKALLPLLIIKGEKENDNKLISLQPESGRIDVDKAFESALATLKSTEFNVAIFSYSTKMSFDGKSFINAIKTVIMFKDGFLISFFSPYEIKGFIKKEVYIGKSSLGEIEENIFN